MLCLFICSGLLNLIVSAQEPAFTLEISVNEPVYLNDSAVVQIKVNTITVPLSALQFTLQFDSAFLTPVITENSNDEMNAFLKKSPQNGWEQLCRYDSSNTVYTLRFSAPEGAVDENKLIKTADDLLIEIPFTTKSEGEATVTIADSSIIGIDKDLGIISGKGTEKKFSIYSSSSTGKIQLKSSSSFIKYTSGENVYITGVREKTSVSDFLGNFINSGLTLLDANGNPYTREICGTGMKICLYDGETLLDSITLVVKGDLDGDGTVSPIDYLYIRKFILNNISLDDTQIQAGLLSDTDKITPIHALRLKKYILGNYNIYE